MLKIYHNPRCKISRKGLQIIQDKNLEVEIIDYQKSPFKFNELEKLLMKLNINAIDLVRKNEAIYKQQYKGKTFTNEEWIKILIENPKLIERPIIEKEYKAMIGRPTEDIADFL